MIGIIHHKHVSCHNPYIYFSSQEILVHRKKQKVPTELCTFLLFYLNLVLSIVLQRSLVQVGQVNFLLIYSILTLFFDPLEQPSITMIINSYKDLS